MFTEAVQRYSIAAGVVGFPGPRNDGDSHARPEPPKPHNPICWRSVTTKLGVPPDTRPISMKYAAYSLQSRAL